MPDNVKLVPGTCTQCGAKIDVDPQKDAAVCPYCGTPYVVEKAISNYNTFNIHHTRINNVRVGKQGAVESVINFVDKQLEKKRQKEEEERRRLEEERRKREERMRKVREQVFGEAHRKRNLIILAVIAGIILLSVVSGTIKRASMEKEPPIVTNDIEMPVSSSSLEGENYENVVKRLKNAGFTNVKTKALEDLIMGWLTKDGEIAEVSVNGETSFSAGAKFDKDADIVVTYHTFYQSRESDSTDEASETQDTPEESVAENEPDTDNREEATPVEEDNTDSDLYVDETFSEFVEPETEVADIVLSAENNSDLAALLQVRDPTDSVVANFANTYQGRTITFNGHISAMAQHGSYQTRYDILIGVGNYEDTTLAGVEIGPYFQFNNVNYNSLNFTGSHIPDSVGVGTNLRVTATVGTYSEMTSLFQISPVSIEIR